MSAGMYLSFVTVCIKSEQITSAHMKSHHLVSKVNISEKFHDSRRMANRYDRHGSRASVKAALQLQKALYGQTWSSFLNGWR